MKRTPKLPKKDKKIMGATPSFMESTDSIHVSVLPVFLNNQSDPCDNIYVWAYHICIENKGEKTLQLISRYWKITDALGRIQEVRGSGVVGEQPILKPGDTFEYTSSVTLSLPSGVMVGKYQMESLEGEKMEIGIPLFSLDSPQSNNTIH